MCACRSLPWQVKSPSAFTHGARVIPPQVALHLPQDRWHARLTPISRIDCPSSCCGPAAQSIVCLGIAFIGVAFILKVITASLTNVVRSGRSAVYPHIPLQA